MTKILGEPPLIPPDAPDMDDPCDECGKHMGNTYQEVQCEGFRPRTPVYVCSKDCETQYLNSWAEHVLDSRSDYE